MVIYLSFVIDVTDFLNDKSEVIIPGQGFVDQGEI